MNLRLDGKVAIITGSSRGIGAAIAIGYAEAGASLLLVSRSTPSEETLARLEATGQPYYCLSSDLIDV
ncbi:MAG: SDR family NAD(P)-dependent oxidoreductase [Chloroflexi bacterium]|uniref:SDR family NAD(P)-dependent oxidoreductase n=1 Tax=Candidatus Chlorohelix allophototropha TaxID=3003348 RepID=A0A8T7LT96_9CHLR|nr:SDR family NAD(P)-dependent oxidoreductase [Chloroflexota bacterium]WJW67111.1 SDR family NAD(P)-dependent oxidoreductase [Chloroflexota bacterium L227-S17]